MNRLKAIVDIRKKLNSLVLLRKDNNVLFFLRSTRLNKNLQSACKEYIFKDFANE